jgi:hypothetical protein
MQLLRGALLLLAALVAVNSGVFAQVESSPVPIAAKPDFTAMMFMTGSWSCSVLSARRPGPYIVTSTTSVSPDGYWLVTQNTVHKASWIPKEFVSIDKMTYDPSTNQWVDITTDELGGYDLSTSPGWNGNQIVWTDVTYPKTNATAVNNPTTVTKMSDTKTTAENTFKEPGGRVVSVKTTCNKTT